MEVDGEEADGGCTTVTRVNDVVAPHGQARPVWVLFRRSITHDNASVRDVSSLLGGYVCFTNEENSVSALHPSGHALGESSHFVVGRVRPFCEQRKGCQCPSPVRACLG